MILKHLLDDLNRVAAALHPYAETGIESVRAEAGELVFSTDLEGVIHEKDKEIADLGKDLDGVAKEAEKETRRADNAEALLDEFKDPESGTTVVQYKERTERAEEFARRWKRAHDEMERELTALRKRKGVTAAVVKNLGEITQLIYAVARGEESKAKAIELTEQLKADAK